MIDTGGLAERLLRDSALFSALDADVRRAVADRLDPVSIDGGEVLMREGDRADGLYLVRAGRLQARAATEAGEVVVGEIGRGEVVGEAALLVDQPRSATVVALRDSELLHLSVDAFEGLVAEHPSFLRPMSAQVVARMLASRHGPVASRPVTTVAVVPVHDTAVAGWTVDALASALLTVVDRARAVGASDRPAGADRVEWAQDLESANDLVVYRCHADADEWTRLCMRQSDVVVVVADATRSPALTPFETVLGEHRRRIDVPVELVLAHPASCVEPSGTRRWLAPRQVRRHHHVRDGDDAHAARVARLVTNRGIGVVLSGGGARSMAEIGVVRAMVELGIPIDALGGTSAGALVAGAFARGWSVDGVRAALHEGMVAQGNPVDLTVPFTSLAAGRRMTERLQEAAGELDIEDLWLSYFCVSTNLSRNAPEVHRRGRGWRAVRASMSIPGVFPPVAEGDDVLVDGGLVDNLPVEEMRRGHDGITVIAVDVGVRRGMTAGDLPDSTVVHGWRLVLDRLHPGRKSPNVAGILSILTRLTELGGGGHAADRGDLCVRPGVERFAMLDFSNFDELVDVGHHDALPVLRTWWEARAT